MALLTIDRVERRNALDHEALEQILEAHGRTRSARVVVLTGSGGHFCAGAAVLDIGTAPTGHASERRRLLRRLTLRIAPAG